MARPSSKKPTAPRAPSARTAKGVETPVEEAPKPIAKSQPVVKSRPAVKKAPVLPVVEKAPEPPVAIAPVEPVVMAPAAPAEIAPAAPAEIVTPETVEWPVQDVAGEDVATESVAEPNLAPQPVDVVPEPVRSQLVEPFIVEHLIPEPIAPEAIIVKGSFIMSDVIETAKSYAEEAKTRIQGAVAEMNDKAKAAMEKSSKALEEMGELAKGNLEAIVESSKIAAKGVESFGQEAADFGRKSFEKSSATFKSFAAVKSPAEFFQLQSELMSATMDAFASEAAKNSEAMLKLAGEVSQPISNRVAIVTEKMKALAA